MMVSKEAVRFFPECLSGVIELSTVVVTHCHNSDLSKMLIEAEEVLEGVYAQTHSTSKNLKQTLAVEAFLRGAIPIFLEQSFDPDKETMLSRCRKAKEVMPERAEAVAPWATA